ncbi:hypothetical protein SLE2022_379340 [Rubroshorea leprosula]
MSCCRRRRPLEACGLSMYAIAQSVYTKTQGLNGPLGSMMKKTTKLVAAFSPLLCALQCQLLVIISFLDDYILALESKVENIFPPTKHIFDKTDDLVRTVETLPAKFEDAMNKFPMIIHHVPLLDWTLVHTISWLNFLISILTYWGLHGTKEKEIGIDKDYNEYMDQSTTINKAHHHHPVESSSNRVMKGTYKEVLEKGMSKNEEKKEDFGKKDEAFKEGEEKDIMVSGDPILELFESTWLMRPTSKGRDNVLSRSVSYT